MGVNYACCGGGCCGGGEEKKEEKADCCGGSGEGCCNDGGKMPKAIVVTGLKDAKDGQVKEIAVAGRKIALVVSGRKFYALDGVCAHKGGPLGKGLVKDGALVCPLHGAKFRLEDGSVVSGPAEKSVKTYPVEVRGDELTIKLE